MNGSIYKKDTSRLVSPQDWQRAKSLLPIAAGLEGRERARLIESRFPEEPKLRTELLSLLEVHDKVKGALSSEQITLISGSQTTQPPTVPASRAEQVMQVGAAYGPYHVVRLIGAGGMGQVYLANDVRLERRVALKSLAGSWLNSPTARQRLMREARTAAALSHPNIVTLFDVVDNEQCLLLVMEYVEGRTAAALVEDGRIPLGHALRITKQICEALIYAHDRGFIHCDLKPSNIQVTPEGIAKVLDFGLSRAKYDHYEIDPDLAKAGLVLIGTPPYMPPERLLKGTVGVSGDIYSLGVTLFEMVTGRLPFEERESATLIGAIIGTEAPAVSSLVPDVPSSVDQVVARALAKNPKERYQTASEFSRDLEDALRGLDNATMESPPGDLRQKQVRTYPRTMLAMAAILGTIVGLTLIGYITSNFYGSPLGLTASFEGESPLWWPVWGIRSLILPLGQIVVAILIIAVVIQLWRIAVAAIGPLRRYYGRLLARNGKLQSWAESVPRRTLGGSLVVAHVLALEAFWWKYHELIGSITNFLVNSGSIENLNTVHAIDHKWYMRALSLILLAFGWGWYRLWKMKSRAPEPRSAAPFVAGAAAMIVSLFFMTVPYRLFFQSKGERVLYQSQQCYRIGKHGNDVLLFCQTQDPPWTSRLVNLNDPALKHTGTRESIFSATTTNQPKSQKTP